MTVQQQELIIRQFYNMHGSSVNEEKEVFIDPDSSLPKTYFQLIEKVGSSGKYQTNLFLIFILVFFVNGSVMLSTSFLFMNDRYACEQLGLLTENCKKTVCQIQNEPQRNNYFIQNLQEVESAATDYGPFMCDDQFLLDLIKSCPYFGSFLAFIGFSYISDNFGRRKTMIISLALASLGSLLIVLSMNLSMVAIGAIMAGGGINVSAGIVFYFFGETVENLKRQKYSIIVQAAYTISAMMLTALYMVVGKWRVISIILTAIPSLVLFFVFLLYVQQTPLFLLKGDNETTLKALNRIGYINFGIKDMLTEEDIENVKAQQLATQGFTQNNVSPLDLLRFTSLRITTIISCLLSYIVISMYYGPTLIIDSIGFNTYVSSFAIQLSQIVGFIPTYFYIDKAKRKSTGFILFLITVISALIISMIEKPQNCNFCYQSLIELCLVFIFRLCIAVEYALFLVYTVELFPTRVVGLGVGALSAFGTIASTLSPLILGALKRIQFNLMLFFFILGVIGGALTLILDQTLGRPLKTEIDQVLYAKNKRKTQYVSAIESKHQRSKKDF